MLRKTKRQRHSKSISYAFLRQRTIESDNCSRSSEACIDSEANDTSQERSRRFKQEITNTHLSSLFELCKAKCPVKHLSVLLYMTLQKFAVSWRDGDIFLKEIGE